MPKIKVEANELIGVEATHVSLVKRGANRVPFRIVKNADGKRSPLMFSFDRLFHKKADPVAPAVAAVVVSKSLSEAQAKHVVTKAGFDASGIDSGNEAVFLFPQVEGEIEGQVLKVDDNLAIVVTGEAIKKAFEGMNFESMDFGSVMAQEGFVPSVDLAMGMLRNTVANILSKAESRDQMVSAMEQAIDEFGEFVTALSSAVPDQAFNMQMMKSEDLLSDFEAEPAEEGEEKVEKAEEDTLTDQIVKAMNGDKEKKRRGKYKGKATEEEEEMKGAKKSDDSEASESAEGASEGEEAPEAEAGEETLSEASGEPDMAQLIADSIQAAMAPVTEAIGSVQKAVEEQGKQIAEVKTKADEAGKVAKAAQTAVKGRVNGEPSADPDPAQTRKSEDGGDKGEPALIDTGYFRVN